MERDFDPGYGLEPFHGLCADYPDESVYPYADFRVEWGPIFHRGRLDGTAHVLVIGQDPAEQEAIGRRILLGEAGHRVQGFLAKLGIDISYVMINTFLYSVYGQQSGNSHAGSAAIAAYRHRWLGALLDNENDHIEAVVAFGSLADEAWRQWLETPDGGAHGQLPYEHVPHPTSPGHPSNTPAAVAAQTKAMLLKWNQAIQRLRPAITQPDAQRPFVPYGDAFTPEELPDIPPADLPPGTPDWMRGASEWAQRTGGDASQKRQILTVTVPAGVIP